MNNTTQKFDDREAWLTAACEIILDGTIMPVVEESPYKAESPDEYERPPFRVSLGFPKRSRGGRVIAVCFARAASADGVNEIFVSPEMDDPIEIMQALVHELIHAVDDGKSGHRRFFEYTARAVGLAGKLTETFAGDELLQQLHVIADALGPLPHARLNLDAGRKKGGTRQLLVKCGKCDFKARASAVQVRRWEAGNNCCPACSFPLTVPRV